MRLVIVCSPFGGDIRRNVAYARACVADCIQRGEAPLAPHLLYTQPGILDDTDPARRRLGIKLGHEALVRADAMVTYVDLGVSSGMIDDQAQARELNVEIEERQINGWALGFELIAEALRPFPLPTFTVTG